MNVSHRIQVTFKVNLNDVFQNKKRVKSGISEHCTDFITAGFLDLLMPSVCPNTTTHRASGKHRILLRQ